MGFIEYRLQQYEDGTFGYLHVDGDKYENTTTGSKVVLQQAFHEDRADFIEKNHIEFQKNQYGSNLFRDLVIIEGSEAQKLLLVRDNYGLDKLINDSSEKVRKAVAYQGYHDVTLDINKILPPIINKLEKFAQNSIYAIKVTSEPIPQGYPGPVKMNYFFEYYFTAKFNDDDLTIYFDGTLKSDGGMWGTRYSSSNITKTIKYTKKLLEVKDLLSTAKITSVKYIADEKISEISYNINNDVLEIYGPKNISEKANNQHNHDDHAYDPAYWGWT